MIVIGARSLYQPTTILYLLLSGVPEPNLDQSYLLKIKETQY